MHKKTNWGFFSSATNKKADWLLLLLLIILFLFCLAKQVVAFSWSTNTIQQVAIYMFDEDEDLVLVPNSINWNLDPDNILALFKSVDWNTIYDCSDWGAVTSAVIYIKFSDGTITPYEYTPPYISRSGIYGMCREVNDEGDNFIQDYSQ